MNPPIDPTESDPRAREQLEPTPAVDPFDERLSAALDGAADPGFAAESVPDADPEARGPTIAAARDLLAVAPPPLDDLTRRRLLKNAVDAWEAPRRRRRDWVARAGAPAAAAACVALVVLGVWALIHTGVSSKSGSGSKFASSATSGPSATAAGKLDLREVSDPAVLRQKVEAALRGAAPTNAPEAGPVPTAATHGPVSACLPAVRVPAGVHADVLGPATFHGAPAVVIVARDGPRTLIYVLATADCGLLSSQFLRQ
jgi:hypothetical protein